MSGRDKLTLLSTVALDAAIEIKLDTYTNKEGNLSRLKEILKDIPFVSDPDNESVEELLPWHFSLFLEAQRSSGERKIGTIKELKEWVQREYRNLCQIQRETGEGNVKKGFDFVMRLHEIARAHSVRQN